MPNIYDLVQDLTTRDLSQTELRRALNDFSSQLGWRPSYHLIEPPLVGHMAKAHLVVEHGLEPAAVITFLDRTNPFSNIQLTDQYRILEISYNNLVDWHLCVEYDKVSFCFNRTRPFSIVQVEPISRANFNALRNEAFDQLIGRRPNPNLPNLDEALIKTISSWKRNLAADMGASVSNVNLSALFNAIIFVRAVEDQNRRTSGNLTKVLLDEWEQNGDTFRNTIKKCLKRFTQDVIPMELVDEDKLEPFDTLERSTVRALFSDFYKNQYAPYNYDFSLMSKHALSRIYEHYSSLLFVEDSPQARFFPAVPEEEWNKTYGSIYTPQFIAGFFARFLREQKPPSAFRRIRTVDPACGSGIFLRTLLELQCDPIQDGVNSETISRAFDNVLGLDVDESASQATRLSLSLLYLTLTGTLPTKLNVVTTESIEYFLTHPELKESFDAVIVNPPFISSGNQSETIRQRISKLMGEDSSGWVDTYLAFLHIGMEMVKPGGYGLYVLPHSFLLSNSARSLRKSLSNGTWIRCLADLSAIQVFGQVGSYIVLLIFEKKSGTDQKGDPAAIIKCQDLVGHALEDFLDGHKVETSSYSIYDVDQQKFTENEWVILPETESNIQSRLASLPKLDDYVHIREGMITGADEVFIIDAKTVPEGGSKVFIPLLTDREMMRYQVPKRTEKRVFYPFIEGRRISLEELKDRFGKTYEYLSLHRATLEARMSVQKGKLEWWSPIWPRLPEHLLIPKIISPHLVLLPRFSLDEDGKYAISRSPLLYPKERIVETDLLRFLVGIMNSSICHWYISTHSHKYSRGYLMLEPKTLKHVPVPDLARISAKTMRELIDLVNRRLTNSEYATAEREIEKIVLDIYGLSSQERRSLGIEERNAFS